MNVMLLAAGEGTRLRPHTLTLPKPAIPFLNIPLAAYPLSFLGSHRIDKLVINTYHLPEKIVSTFEKLPHRAQEIIFSHEKKEILGSGGGLKKVEKILRGSGDFLLMNADEVIIPKDPEIFQQALEFHKKNKNMATLIVMNYPGVGTKFGGVWTQGPNVISFGKDRIGRSDQGWHFIGPQILTERVFKYLPKEEASNILYDGLQSAIAAGEKVQIFPIECTWFETGNEVDFLTATKECLDYLADGSPQGAYLKAVLQKYSLIPSHLKRGSSHLELSAENAQVAPDASLAGFVVAAEGAVVPSGCQLNNVVVGPGVQLPEKTVLANTIVVKI